MWFLCIQKPRIGEDLEHFVLVVVMMGRGGGAANPRGGVQVVGNLCVIEFANTKRQSWDHL